MDPTVKTKKITKKVKNPEAPSIVVEYLNYHNSYTEKYGPNTLILMQVGSFYEAYATTTSGPDLQCIANTINIACTRKDKSIETIDIKNPYMMGFNMVSAQKFIGLLISNGYTLVMVDQVTLPPDVTRKVTNIYSPGTYIENVNSVDTNFITCVYFEEEPQRSGLNILCAGISSIDLSTGKSYIHEAISSKSDPKLALDETVRFINSINPKETIIYYTPRKNGTPSDQLVSYLELSDRSHLVKSSVPSDYHKISYQNEFLKKIYPNTGILSPIEYIGLDNTNYSRLSWILLLEFAHAHNVNIIKDLAKPEQYMDNKYMVLGNNALYQLDVIESNIYNEHKITKFKSLVDVVTNTSTAQGRRYLTDRLTSPLVSSTDINILYDNTSQMIDGDTWKQVEKHLNQISDVERLGRKLSLSILHPCELVMLIESVKEAIEISNKLKVLSKLSNVLLSAQTISSGDNFIKNIEDTCVITELKKYTQHNITDTFFKPGVFVALDRLANAKADNKEFIGNLAKVLEDYLTENPNKKATGLALNKITVKETIDDKYYLALSKPRANMLIQNLQCVEHLDILGKQFPIKNLVFDLSNKTTGKITIKEIPTKNQDMLQADRKIIASTLINELAELDDLSAQTQTQSDSDQIAIMTKRYYLTFLSEMYTKYFPTINAISKFISYVDYIKSNAKTAINYNYTRPVIKESKSSYIQCRQIRHPIIERIIDYEYVPHDISLGQELKGMLIYGTNSSGKSSIMKSLGLSLILAQAGMFVPAMEFVYCPYTSLYTRINGMDNIFRGLSSFAVEMLELKAILQRANANTLVIGDEVCRGTEHVSANSLVASTIINLERLGSSFIFATHLHDIAKMDRIKKLSNVRSFHISIKYDDLTDTIIYDRKLSDGPGEPVYGITFARHIIHDNSFIELACEIKNELLRAHNEFVPQVKSHYNSDVYVSECNICGKQNEKSHISNLETHHILFQKDFTDNFSEAKPHIKKNSKANLIVLCNDCHDKLHRGEFKIDGYQMTSNGKQPIISPVTPKSDSDPGLEVKTIKRKPRAKKLDN